MANMRSQKRPSKRMKSRSGGKSRIAKSASRQPTYTGGNTSGQMSHMKNC